jgi:hypothetical protein
MNVAFAASAMRAAIVLLIIGAAAWVLSEGFRRFTSSPRVSETEAL